jgi:hypothetical protein
MSDTMPAASPFPMPQTVPAKPVSDHKPVSDYAPRRANAVGAEAVAEAVERLGERNAPPAPRYTPPSPYPAQPQSTHTAAIREAIKKLTHREMREMVEMIFKARDKIAGVETGDAISRTTMADVLDAFAHGE